MLAFIVLYRQSEFPVTTRKSNQFSSPNSQFTAKFKQIQKGQIVSSSDFNLNISFCFGLSSDNKCL